MTVGRDLQRLKALAVSESGVLFDPATGNTYTMNRVATEILRALQEGQSLETVRAMLARRYEVDPATLERDVKEFMVRIASLGLA